MHWSRTTKKKERGKSGIMARLVSYKAKDENRYSTFGNEVSCNSNENLTESRRFTLIPKKKIRPTTVNNSKSSSVSTMSSSTAPNESANKTALLSATENPTHRMSNMNEQHCNRNIGKRFTNNNIPGSRTGTISSSRLALCSKLCCRQQQTYPILGKCGWFVCCWACCAPCKRFGCCGNRDAGHDDDDDDIDAKFEQYKAEMRLKENMAVAAADGAGITSKLADRPRSSFGRSGKKYWHWNWNDSLRSNSDKFLETLEHDLDSEGCGAAAFRRSGGYCNPMMRNTQGCWFFFHHIILFLLFDKCMFAWVCVLQVEREHIHFASLPNHNLL